MEYEKLIKELRDAFKTATEANTNPYRFVPYYTKAADAIEELSKRVEFEIAMEECWHRLENRPLPDIPEQQKEEV